MHLLFDLDGTLTDSREGIVRCFQHALCELGRPVPDAADLTRYVGPPLPGSLATLLETTDTALIESAIACYRDRFERLHARGHRLSIVTAKALPYAQRIAEHFGIAGFFSSIHGPDLGQRQYSKAAFVADALALSGVAPANALVVGDRSDDVLAAHSAGVRAIGVMWGYGAESELAGAGADRIIATVEQLAPCIEDCAAERLRDREDAVTPLRG